MSLSKNDALLVSVFFPADDFILFREAPIEQMNVMISCLQQFYERYLGGMVELKNPVFLCPTM